MPALVEQLEMPLASVREAVKRAESAALVTVMPKRGIVVMRADPAMTRECLELRTMFDCEGARRIIEKGLDVPLDALRASHIALREQVITNPSPELPAQAVEIDLSLHDALATGLGSQLAERLYADNRDRIAIIQNTRPFLVDRIASAMDEHLEIMDHLAAGNTDLVCTAIRGHLANTLRWWGIVN